MRVPKRETKRQNASFVFPGSKAIVKPFSPAAFLENLSLISRYEMFTFSQENDKNGKNDEFLRARSTYMNYAPCLPGTHVLNLDSSSPPLD